MTTLTITYVQNANIYRAELATVNRLGYATILSTTCTESFPLHIVNNRPGAALRVRVQ